LSGVHTQDPSPPRVLIVEDDASIRRVLNRVFRDGYEVHEAADGQAGLERARELAPAVVITDQRMPKLTGVELLAAVKEMAPRTVRILVTGYAEYGPLVDAVNAAHVHHYVEKPFHAKDLRLVVDALCRTATLEQERTVLLKNLEDTVAELEDANRRLRDSEANLAGLVRERTDELQKANEELHVVNDDLREMAIRDSLTGLFNHRCLMDHLEL
jgi:response regulator RpfG family c-di-GMP phosphodiesterase